MSARTSLRKKLVTTFLAASLLTVVLFSLAINRIVSDKGANIAGQILATDPEIGYLVMDLDQNVSDAVKNAVAALDFNIKTRILY